MKELLNEIDELLTRLEDFTHGKDGEDITKIRGKIQEQLKTNDKMSIIKENRIVSDKTFATRLVSFLKDIKVSDPISEEELDYMRRIAHSLLLHQANTATEKEEKEYLHKFNPNGI